MKNIELTISVKRSFRGKSIDIFELIEDLPGIEFVGGDRTYAIDVRAPSKAERSIMDRVAEACDVEHTVQLQFLGRRR
ncbi:hypothetical protein ACFSOZ_23555 [Mesorhizobium newzealandense]|uniref:Uncharacterized protein n=1 Tax=Mesorhizobium newzealandense TaxID=1300302 RepID=A0ABW4UH67_9HYPH